MHIDSMRTRSVPSRLTAADWFSRYRPVDRFA